MTHNTGEDLTDPARCTVVHHPKTGAEVIYLHADCVELKVFGTCTRDAMERLHSFVGGMLEHREFP